MTSTASKTQDLRERQQKYLAPSLTNMLYYGDDPIAVDHAKDQYLWDVEGTRYLDFFGGILTVSVGHCNDEVIEATYEQMKRTGHTSTLYINEITLKVAEKIAEITPGRLQHSFLRTRELKPTKRRLWRPASTPATPTSSPSVTLIRAGAAP